MSLKNFLSSNSKTIKKDSTKKVDDLFEVDKNFENTKKVLGVSEMSLGKF
jgi:hypothetical protein